MELLAAFVVGIIVGTWVSRRKAVARAFAQGVESVTAQATATGGSVVFVGSADEYRSLGIGLDAVGRIATTDDESHDNYPTTATYTGRRAIRLARGRVDRAVDGTGRAVGAGGAHHDIGPVRPVKSLDEARGLAGACSTRSLDERMLREPWRWDEADPRFDPHEADSIDQADEDDS